MANVGVELLVKTLLMEIAARIMAGAVLLVSTVTVIMAANHNLALVNHDYSVGPKNALTFSFIQANFFLPLILSTT